MIIDSKNSKLFSANLLFRSTRNGKFLPDNMWEESIILINASTPEQALEKANAIGIARACSYKTISGDELTWQLFKVERIFEIDEFGDGAEIFSRHLRNSEVESLLTPFVDD